MTSSCVSCGAESSEGARFCHVCGAALWTTCPACGSEQSASATFCSSCGTALRSDAQRSAVASEHEERRVVTVLFADLAGSTALGESVDPEDVREVQGELFELVGREVERHGGITEKFVGDAVVAVFGAPQAHEDDAERAVRAALAIRDGFPALAARIAERHGADVGLRIGVNTCRDVPRVGMPSPPSCREPVPASPSSSRCARTRGSRTSSGARVSIHPRRARPHRPRRAASGRLTLRLGAPDSRD